MVLNSVIESPELGHIYMYMFLNYVPVGREGVNQEQGSKNSWATLQHYLVKSRWQNVNNFFSLITFVAVSLSHIFLYLTQLNIQYFWSSYQRYSWHPVLKFFVPLLTGDEKGSIIAWRYTEENLFEACPVQDHIFSVALSYISQGEIAVGWVQTDWRKFHRFFFCLGLLNHNLV